MYFKQLWYVDRTHCISLIQGLPKRILYCVISPSITCNTVWTIFNPTIIGTNIDPTIGHKASLKAFNYKVRALMCENGIFRFWKVVVDIMFIADPSSIKIYLNIFPSTLATMCNGGSIPYEFLQCFISWS